MQPGNTPLHALAAALLFAATAASAGYRTQVGYDQLVQDFGSALPDGSNLTVLQIEASDTSGAWATATTGELSSKSIAFPYSSVSPTKFSAHANLVATNLIGSSCSLLPGAPRLQCVGAKDYRTFSLYMAKFEAPPTATWDLENHSYVGSATTYNTNALQLLDYRINRDLTTVVVAVENGTDALPPLFANTYNSISVGVSSGAHSRGGSTLDGVGRMKPDLVASASYTSYATPMVTSAAGLLLSEAKRTAALAAARDPRVVKALLMAGAVKTKLSTWSNTTAQPLDPIYGAGELNINNAYRMLVRGRQSAGASFKATDGWDVAKSSASTVYYLQVPTGQTLTLSAVLTWHRDLTTSDYWGFTSTVPDLALRLRNSTTGFAKGTVIAESNSALDNVEHIYRTALPAGCYALEVTGPAGVVYGLAWHGELVGAPVTVAPTAASLPVTATATTTQSATLSASGTIAAPTGCSAEILRTSAKLNGSTDVLTTGFTISGRQAKRLIVRGLLTDATSRTARPVLSISANGKRIAYNAGWKANEAVRIRTETARLGAAPLAEDGRDCAVFIGLNPGSYAISLKGDRGTTGTGRIEILDATPDTRSSLGSFAGSATVGAGRPDLVAELNVVGNKSRTYLISAHGSAGAAEPPLVAVFHEGTLLVAGEITSGASVSTAQLTLSPGRYTVQVSSATAQTEKVATEIVERSAP